MIKLSIIIPYYNSLPYLTQLAKVLAPQLTEEVEVIIVDDGCWEWELELLSFPAIVVHLGENSGGASVPRNVGLDFARGQYITFIDSDDMVTANYINTILQMIDNQSFDYCFISWENQLGKKVIITAMPPKWNCCVWNCVYSRSLIGETRFKRSLKKAEDLDFNLRVRKGRRANIVEPLYIYNEAVPQSLSKQPRKFNRNFHNGE